MFIEVIPQAESLKTSKHKSTPMITGRPKVCDRLDAKTSPLGD